MKIGRNEPCPCGSGKKYKKCCLNKTVAPPEQLEYKRISKAMDKLMPRLIEHGINVFDEIVISVAMTEFFCWPTEDEVPDENAIERAAMLFWPWFVFNWEYDSLEDEDDLLYGPEEKTIAEIYLEEKNIDPQSLEGRLINAANRCPYSFLEIKAVRAGQTVTVKDILTGEETVVQERLGSGAMQPGDIVFGRVVLIGNVGIFLGISAYVLPPRFKPELQSLRREMSSGGKWADLDQLYDWDLELREVFLGIDQTLHTMPDYGNTDGDPLEFHKIIYEIDSVDEALEMLASLSSGETIEKIRQKAEKDVNGKIRDVEFEWSCEKDPAGYGFGSTVLGHIEIESGRVTVTVNSRKRAETIRMEIQKRLGDGARFQSDEISDFHSMVDLGQADMQQSVDISAHPELQQHIGNILRDHWNRWVDIEIPALGHRTPRQAVRSEDGREAVEALLQDAEKTARNDPVRLEIEKELIKEVRRELHLDRKAIGNTGGPIPEQLARRKDKLKRSVSEFGSQRLNDTYTEYALRLCDHIADSDMLKITRGRSDIWTAAIVYAIAQLNFLFSSDTPNHLTPDELCNFFGVKKTTTSAKASKIRTTLDIYHDDDRFCAPHITRLFKFFKTQDGFILPASIYEEGEDEIPALIPREPHSEEKTGLTGKTQRDPIKKEKHKDGQLSLFDD